MKFTFAAACLLGVTLADQKFTLADESGLENDNVTTADIRDDQNGFESDWGVGEELNVYADSEDGEGWEIANTYYHSGVKLSISKKDLYDETIFKGSNGVVFNVGVAGGWPDYHDQYAVTLQVKCADGKMIAQNANGYAAEELKKIRLEADTTSCDITNVTVTMFGQDREYWAGAYGAIQKDMELYVWNDSVVEDMFSGLNKTHVIEDHSWINDDGYKVEPEHCFDIVQVTSEQTVEFVAQSSTPANIDRADQFVAGIELYRVTKDGEWIEQVADSVPAEAIGGAKVANQSALVFDQKVEEDTFYQLCFFLDQLDAEDNEYEAQAGSYQYGYHIYDEDFKFEHHTDTHE